MKRMLSGLLLALFAGGCGGGPDGTACPAIAKSNFTVTVTDTSTGLRICDATVSATEVGTGSMMNLMAAGGAADCTYSGGFYESPGTFNITASKSGYIPSTQFNVVVAKATCGIEPAMVSLKLGK